MLVKLNVKVKVTVMVMVGRFDPTLGIVAIPVGFGQRLPNQQATSHL